MTAALRLARSAAGLCLWLMLVATPLAAQMTGPFPLPDTIALDDGSTLDYAAWELTARRGEAAIEDRATPSDTLEMLRAQLADWRDALLVAQSANSTRIANLRSQVAVLGPAPADGESESADFAARRSALTDQLVRLQAPGIAAEEAYRRADGLIREIDSTLRERQADALLKLWPMPINPANWPSGVLALSGTAVGLAVETATLYRQPDARAQFAGSLPLILLLMALAIGLIWRGRALIDQLAARLPPVTSQRARRVIALLLSLGQIIVPSLGVLALIRALTLTGLLGPVGVAIADALPMIGLMVFTAIWLGNRVFPPGEKPGSLLRLPAERRAEGRFLTTAFGVVLALDELFAAATSQTPTSEAAISVVTFPMLAVAGLLLWRMGGLLHSHVANDAKPDEQPSYRNRLIGVLGRVAVIIGVLGPVLAAIGYISAASALIYPAAISLGLIGVLFILQYLIGDVYALITRNEDAGHEALVPVLAGFALSLITLPVFALIWGARWADLTEVWTRVQEGFQLGGTRISPTVFLFFAIVFGILYTLTRLFQGALKATILPRTGMDQGGQNAVVAGVGYVGIFLAALIAINSAGIDLSGLAIVAGALSVGIGFGLQNIVSNFVSGIILLIERPVSEGDWIEVGNVQGRVRAISVRSTRIETFDRSDVIVPNLDLVSGRVTNWTRFSLSGRLVVPVAVPYTADSRQVEKILREIAERQPLAILTPPPLIVFTGFAGEAMNFEIRVILRDVNFNVQVRSDINHEIASRFAAAGIDLSNAHRDHRMRLAADEAALQLDADAMADAMNAVRDTLAIPKPKQQK